MRLAKQLLIKYNPNFIKQWQFTINFRIWQSLHSPKLFALSKYSDFPVQCSLYYENGDVYVGDIFQGLRHGNGTLSYDNGESVYEGEWKENKRQGTGHQITKEGKYSGNFLENKFHGYGTYCESNGTIYEGEWCQNSRNGVGHLSKASGDQYVGDFKYGNMHGKGQYTQANGDIYLGDFMNNLRHGSGGFKKKNGESCEGNWIEDKFMGASVSS